MNAKKTQSWPAAIYENLKSVADMLLADVKTEDKGI